MQVFSYKQKASDGASFSQFGGVLFGLDRRWNYPHT